MAEYVDNAPVRQEWKKFRTNVFGDKALKSNVPEDPKLRQLYFSLAAVVKAYLTDLYGRKNYNDKYKQMSTLIINSVEQKVKKGSTAVSETEVASAASQSGIELSEDAASKLTEQVNGRTEAILNNKFSELNGHLGQTFAKQDAIAAGVTALSADSAQTSSTVQTMAKQVAEVSKMASMISGVVGGLTSFITGIVGGVFKAITGIGKFILNGITGIIKGVFKTITAIISGITKVIYKTLKATLAFVLAPVVKLIGGIAKKVWGLIKAPFVGLKNMITNGFKLITTGFKKAVTIGLKAFIMGPIGQYLIGYVGGLIYFKWIQPLYNSIVEWWETSNLKDFLTGSMTFGQFIKATIFGDDMMNTAWDQIFKIKILTPFFGFFGKDYDSNKSFFDNVKIAIFGAEAEKKSWIDLLWEKSTDGLEWLWKKIKLGLENIWYYPICDADANMFSSMISGINELLVENDMTSHKAASGKMTVGDAITAIGMVAVAGAFGSLTGLLAVAALPVISKYLKARKDMQNTRRMEQEIASRSTERIKTTREQFDAIFEGQTTVGKDTGVTPATTADNTLFAYQHKKLTDQRLAEIRKLGYKSAYYQALAYAQTHNLQSRLDFLANLSSPTAFDKKMQLFYSKNAEQLDKCDNWPIGIRASIVADALYKAGVIEKNVPSLVNFNHRYNGSLTSTLLFGDDGAADAGSEANSATADYIVMKKMYGLTDEQMQLIAEGASSAQLMVKLSEDFAAKHGEDANILYSETLGQLRQQGDQRLESALTALIGDGDQTLTEQIAELKKDVAEREKNGDNSAEFSELKTILQAILAKQALLGDDFRKAEKKYKGTGDVTVFNTVTGYEVGAVVDVRTKLVQANAVRSKLKPNKTE